MGYSGFQVTGMIEGFLGGLKFSILGFWGGLKVSIPGCFEVGRCCKYFGGWLDLS